jgi:hypothetical protein
MDVRQDDCVGHVTIRIEKKAFPSVPVVKAFYFEVWFEKQRWVYTSNGLFVSKRSPHLAHESIIIDKNAKYIQLKCVWPEFEAVRIPFSAETKQMHIDLWCEEMVGPLDSKTTCHRRRGVCIVSGSESKIYEWDAIRDEVDPATTLVEETFERGVVVTSSLIFETKTNRMDTLRALISVKAKMGTERLDNTTIKYAIPQEEFEAARFIPRSFTCRTSPYIPALCCLWTNPVSPTDEWFLWQLKVAAARMVLDKVLTPNEDLFAFYYHQNRRSCPSPSRKHTQLLVRATKLRATSAPYVPDWVLVPGATSYSEAFVEGDFFSEIGVGTAQDCEDYARFVCNVFERFKSYSGNNRMLKCASEQLKKYYAVIAFGKALNMYHSFTLFISVSLMHYWLGFSHSEPKETEVMMGDATDLFDPDLTMRQEAGDADQEEELEYTKWVEINRSALDLGLLNQVYHSLHERYGKHHSSRASCHDVVVSVYTRKGLDGANTWFRFFSDAGPLAKVQELVEEPLRFKLKPVVCLEPWEVEVFENALSMERGEAVFATNPERQRRKGAVTVSLVQDLGFHAPKVGLTQMVVHLNLVPFLYDEFCITKSPWYATNITKLKRMLVECNVKCVEVAEPSVDVACWIPLALYY